jgi:hypothetical protein
VRRRSLLYVPNPLQWKPEYGLGKTGEDREERPCVDSTAPSQSMDRHAHRIAFSLKNEELLKNQHRLISSQ